MKYGQLTECNMRNIFLKKSYTKCGGETIPRPFSKWSKLTMSLDQKSKVLCALLLLYPNLWTIEIYWNQAADYVFLPHIKFWKKKKKRGQKLVSGFIFPFSFSAWFLKKAKLWRHWYFKNVFEIKCIFLIKPFFYMTKTSRQKCYNFLHVL